MTGHPGTCVMPKCPLITTTRNRAGQETCDVHQPVVVSGSYVNDTHLEGGHG